MFVYAYMCIYICICIQVIEHVSRLFQGHNDLISARSTQVTRCTSSLVQVLTLSTPKVIEQGIISVYLMYWYKY